MFKRPIAILSVFIFLCAYTEMGQLLKLPNLFEHFSEHHLEDHDHEISFMEFLAIHYNNTDHHHANKQEHQNLPFKTVSHSVNTVLAFETPDVFSFQKTNIISSSKSVRFSEKFYISDVFACIWLPPKLI